MEQLVTQITGAVNARTLYPPNHPRVVRGVAQILSAMKETLAQRGSDSLTFLIVGDDLVAESDVVRRPTLSQRQFVEMLKRRGVERLTLADGLTEEEAHQIVSVLATGETPQSSPHVVYGRVHVAITDDQNTGAPAEVTADQLDPVREAFARFRIDRKLPLAPMEQMVWSFIDSLSKTTRAILPLAKLKEHDEYTFIHSVNVSLLVLAQARSFGIQGPMLHAFGMAGLLHDIGKLMVPLEVLNSPGKLDGEQWALMQSHAEQGAWYLSESQGTTPLSIVVAYEHHLRFDGRPNYPMLRAPRVPNVASRMTSIADAYDAMSTIRPYQQPLGRATAVQVLQKRVETFYDPMLVANFIRIVEESTPVPPSSSSSSSSS
jgi:HD-GYP domain-containing protein (c-di-GMP phosphodiesterase class II)